ncbi:DUF3775 domain-containing protein [Paracoccus aminophilus]|uniref:DUF3775 domain-containing protein n=1 Tax=Paracoccus aminophilus JCM 7686 TaxID=1367847 RepID=S5YFP5_PARAH|nr:DUF3775 domain-containing protein [Paracoccus aminophilus]AGT10303.1 hypothetical protein JCM7686_3268 [Paracoccus aminophilus JCM 7686]
MLHVTADKIAFVILLAREADSAHGNAARAELREFLDGLNADELAGLVAIMWVGRETFLPDELSEAFETAQAERGERPGDYLTAEPQLADFLEVGLAALGLSPEDEADRIQHPV